MILGKRWSSRLMMPSKIYSPRFGGGGFLAMAGFREGSSSSDRTGRMDGAGLVEVGLTTTG